MNKFFLAVCLLLSQNLYSQYDFDSLYNNDNAFQQAITARADYEDFFNGEALLKITIESDFNYLIKKKFEGEYQPARLTYFINDTVAVRRDITIKARGNTRRRTCFFPPIMLNFPKKETVIKQMQEFDKMKMVIDCKKGEIYDQYLLGEYYAYKLYNLITNYSFRVRLIELTMIDTNDKMKSMTGHAYIIESVEQVAKRQNAIPIETKNIRDQLTDRPTLANGYLFQYLIGNTDWSIPALHNYKIIKSSDPAIPSPYAIPYDFDYSGIINTSYAVPDKRLGIATVRERVYRGVCIDQKYLLDAAQNFKNAREKIYSMYEKSLLESSIRKSTKSYLDEFFRILNNDNSFKVNILEQCRE
jgi:hypothetical protein